jgi:hypothetical protein
VKGVGSWAGTSVGCVCDKSIRHCGIPCQGTTGHQGTVLAQRRRECMPVGFLVFFAPSRLRVRFPSIRPLPHAKPRRPRRVCCMERSSVRALTNETSRLPVLCGFAAFSYARFPHRQQKQSRQASKPQKGQRRRAGSKSSGRGLIARPAVILSRPFRTSARLCHGSPGRCPGLAWVAPLGLGRPRPEVKGIRSFPIAVFA